MTALESIDAALADPALAADHAALRAARAEHVAGCWKRGDLTYKLDATQRRMRAAREAAWRAPPAMTAAELAALPIEERVRRADVPITFFELCARGLGKTFDALVWLLEIGLRVPNGRMLYAAPLREDATKTALDLLTMFILPDCPPGMAPEWRAGDAEFVFPRTRAVLRFRGTNNEAADRLRGPGYHAVVLDEVGTMDGLHSVLGIVEPIASRLGGKVLLTTTPPETPDHESKEIYEEHVVKGAAVCFTLLDNVRLDFDGKARVLLEGVGAEAAADVPAILAGTMRPRKTKTRRERFCEFVVEGTRAIHPEWQDKEEQLLVPEDAPRPEFYHSYEALDPGFVNKSGWLAGYVDFARGLLVVDGEALLDGANTRMIADTIEAREREMWGPQKFAGGHRQPMRRVSDIDHRLVTDLRAEHRLEFSVVDSKNVDADTNYVNLLINGGQLRVSRRCPNLIRQLRTGIWNKKKTDMAVQADGGHYDLLAALRYLCRAADLRANPYPEGFAAVPFGHSAGRPAREAAGLLPKTPAGKMMAGWLRRLR